MSYIDNLNISVDDINDLIKEIEIQTSLIRKKPSEIKSNLNTIERQKELYNYELLNKIYVLPLMEMANRISLRLKNKELTFTSLDDLSIMGRMMVIRNYLTSVGCRLEDITQLIPKNENEVNILFRAYKNGYSLDFDENQPLSNSSRVQRAIDYLIEHEATMPEQPQENVGKRAC